MRGDANMLRYKFVHLNIFLSLCIWYKSLCKFNTMNWCHSVLEFNDLLILTSMLTVFSCDQWHFGISPLFSNNKQPYILCVDLFICLLVCLLFIYASWLPVPLIWNIDLQDLFYIQFVPDLIFTPGIPPRSSIWMTGDCACGQRSSAFLGTWAWSKLWSSEAGQPDSNQFFRMENCPYK